MLVPLEHLAEFAQTFISTLPTERGARAHIVGLSGDLGAGKTTFVQQVARALGVTEPVTSPTFVIAERYEIKHPPFTSLIHIDAYRLEAKEAETIGWGEFIKNPENLVLVEWPENLGDSFPQDAEKLSFTVANEQSRDIVHAK